MGMRGLSADTCAFCTQLQVTSCSQCWVVLLFALLGCTLVRTIVLYSCSHYWVVLLSRGAVTLLQKCHGSDKEPTTLEEFSAALMTASSFGDSAGVSR